MGRNLASRAGLTDKQDKFVTEYLLDHNATQAAIRAGYSERTARQAGAQNLSKPVVRDEIRKAIERTSRVASASVVETIQLLNRLVRASIADAFDEDGVPLAVEDMPEEFSEFLIKSIKMRVGKHPNGQAEVTIYGIQFVDRTPLLQLLGRHLGCWR